MMFGRIAEPHPYHFQPQTLTPQLPSLFAQMAISAGRRVYHREVPATKELLIEIFGKPAVDSDSGASIWWDKGFCVVFERDIATIVIPYGEHLDEKRIRVVQLLPDPEGRARLHAAPQLSVGFVNPFLEMYETYGKQAVGQGPVLVKEEAPDEEPREAAAPAEEPYVLRLTAEEVGQLYEVVNTAPDASVLMTKVLAAVRRGAPSDPEAKKMAKQAYKLSEPKQAGPGRNHPRIPLSYGILR